MASNKKNQQKKQNSRHNNDRVGSSVPTAKDVKDLLDTIEKLRASKVGQCLTELTLHERKRALRFRPGGGSGSSRA